MKFIIYSPKYKETSGGILVLHELNTKLIELGYISEIVYFNELIPITDEIVIYPEIVLDNPLNAKNVVRWELNKAGFINGVMPIYSENDLVVSFIPPFNKYVPNLTVFKLQKEYIQPVKDIDILILDRRNSGIKHNHPTITKLNNTNRGWISRCNKFISYDQQSFLSLEAAMYGATSVVIGNDYKTWKLNPFFKYGVGYNNEQWSIDTKDEVFNYLTHDMVDYSNKSIANFIKLCKKRFTKL